MDFATLNNEQRRAASFEGKNLLVLAGAGTGKTRTIIARAIYLIEHGEDPTRIKILSFTKKSANEIVNRIKVESNNNPRAEQLSGSTFHSWCMDIISTYPQLFHAEKYTCIDAEDRDLAFKLIMGRVCGKKKIKLNQRCILTPDDIQEIFSYAVNTKKSLSDSIRIKKNIKGDDKEALDSILKIKEICESVIKEYINYKKERRYIDYDDMLNIVAVGLKKNEQLRYVVASKYSHILVDEAQDTNPLQWLLLESFYKDCHLFCVGDDAQSIYAFRGADFKSIHSFEERIPDGEVYKLSRNYRSTQEILDLSNWLLNQSQEKYDKDLISDRGAGKKPIIYYLDSDWEEAEIVTSIIQKGYVEDGKYHDFLVLSRGIYAARKIEAACIQKNIPYVIYGGTSLMKSAHVRDAISALRIISNYRDELAWTRYLLLWQGIGEVSAARIISNVLDQESLANSVACIRSMLPSGTDAYDTLLELMNVADCPEAAIDLAVKHMEQRLQQRYDNWDYRKHDFDALKLVAQKCSDIASFITEYVIDPAAELSGKDPSKTPLDTIIISTIHSAKGLEAKHCFIINVTPKSFPSSQAVTEDEIEEERRCLYVAMTRAKDYLHIMSRKRTITSLGDYMKLIDKNDGSTFGKVVNVRKISSGEGEPIERYFINTGKRIVILSKEEMDEKYDLVRDEEQNMDQYFLNKLPESLVETYKGVNSPAEQTGYEATPFEDSNEEKMNTNDIQINSDFDFN